MTTLLRTKTYKERHNEDVPWDATLVASMVVGGTSSRALFEEALKEGLLSNAQ